MHSAEPAIKPAHLALTPPLPFSPPPIEDGWELGPPDFVGIGAMRSGTTWWWSVLKGHPGIASARGGRPDRPDSGVYANKEFHFFDHHGTVEHVDPALYHRYFPRPAGLLVGEWTPRYMYDYWTPPMLHGAAPDARLLVMLRDPVERLVSGVARFSSRGFAADAALYHDQFNRGLYWQQLAHVLRYYPREQVLVLQYEQCVRDFAAQAHRTFEFLGLDPGKWYAPEEPSRPVGIVTRGASVFNAETSAAVRNAYQADISQLLANFPELDGDLWPSVIK